MTNGSLTAENALEIGQLLAVNGAGKTGDQTGETLILNWITLYSFFTG